MAAGHHLVSLSSRILVHTLHYLRDRGDHARRSSKFQDRSMGTVEKRYEASDVPQIVAWA